VEFLWQFQLLFTRSIDAKRDIHTMYSKTKIFNQNLPVTFDASAWLFDNEGESTLVLPVAAAFNGCLPF